MPGALRKDVGDALSYRARARSAIAQCATASLRQARAPLSGIEGAKDIPECAPGTADRRTIGLFTPFSPPISVSNCKDDATRPASGHSRLAPSHPNHRLNLPTRPIGNAQQPTSARPPIIRQTRYSQGSSPMTDSPRPELDMETQEFVHQLFDLARQGNSQRLEQLLQQGLPPNLRNHKGDSLLMLASYHGHADTVRLLLAYKADPDLRNLAGQTPLAGAAFKGDLAMVELLLAGGADVEGASADGKTALMMAAMFNQAEVAASLLAHGARRDAQDAAGLTPLAAARMMNAEATVALLSRPH
ncbi:putative ankyrin repeat protein PA3287 [Pseudomonas aeruginosa]|nr:putative ankyrin repeat protein PA3287 [Pseudomonas aeruginosa]